MISATTLLRRNNWPWLIAICINIAVLFALFLEGRWLVNAGKPVTHDFLPLWTAAKHALHGENGLIYTSSVASKDDLPFLHPPHSLLFLMPFGAMRYSIAAVAFLAITGCAYATALNMLLRDRLKSAVVALAGGGAFFNLWYVQIGFLTSSLMIGGLALMRRRPASAGVLFGFLTIKPHLGLALAVMLLVMRQWRVILVAATTAFCLMLLASVFFGVDSWRNYFDFASHANPLISGSNWFKMQSLFAAIRPFGGFWIAAAVHAFVAIAALSVMAKLWLSDRDFEATAAATIAATLLVTPYLFTYDATMLTGAAAFMAVRRLHNADMAMLFFACLLPLAALYLLSITVPIAAILTLYVAARHTPLDVASNARRI